MPAENPDIIVKWFAMRDLSRSHAKLPAYKLLSDQDFEVFTPMTNKIILQKGKRTRKSLPFIQDLLFVHSCREQLDRAVEKIENLQYRYVRGGFCELMVVSDAEMDRFIYATETSHAPRYFTSGEINPEMYGAKVRIVGSDLDGYEGYLLKVKGSKLKRLMVSIPNFLTAAVEVNPEYIIPVED